MDLGIGTSPSTRMKFKKATRAVEKLQTEVIFQKHQIEALEAKLERLKPKKRRKIPNPNKRFMTLATILLGSEVPEEPQVKAQEEPQVDETKDEVEEDSDENDDFSPGLSLSSRYGPSPPLLTRPTPSQQLLNQLAVARTASPWECQDFSDKVPSCATSCISPAALTVGCSDEEDYSCECSMFESTAFLCGSSADVASPRMPPSSTRSTSTTATSPNTLTTRRVVHSLTAPPHRLPPQFLSDDVATTTTSPTATPFIFVRDHTLPFRVRHLVCHPAPPAPASHGRAKRVDAVLDCAKTCITSRQGGRLRRGQL
ncbi:hypothetical protein B0T24DRAFT_681909 [Lasiosphaeria ovina]|uniref:Uncharacterized protein n=1 Tax=Lasiosphaeria ovina TaxID=92902 RepID=A0AAE0JZ43_9PEZI|nr:hypothetical protein B0T24DRAFT_681909 [Lasiosphaeria ovina]